MWGHIYIYSIISEKIVALIEALYIHEEVSLLQYLKLDATATATARVIDSAASQTWSDIIPFMISSIVSRIIANGHIGFNLPIHCTHQLYSSDDSKRKPADDIFLIGTCSDEHRFICPYLNISFFFFFKLCNNSF